MVFLHGQQLREEKYRIGYRDKEDNLYENNQAAVAAVREDVGATSNENDSANSVPQPPAKISRADKNWSDNYQVQRALNYNENKVAKLLLKSNNLSKKNESLKGTVHEQKSTIKNLTHQMHVDAKANRTAAVQAEYSNKAALAALAALEDLAEDFASKIEEAYAIANTETEKKLEAESCRILADREHMKSLVKERTKHNEKMIKECARKRAVVAHSHKQWIKTLGCNLYNQNKASDKEQKKESEKMQNKLEVVESEINDERKFNQDR